MKLAPRMRAGWDRIGLGLDAVVASLRASWSGITATVADAKQGALVAVVVFRSATSDGFAVLTTFGTLARIGVLAADFYAGPTSRFDLGNTLVMDLFSGTFESVRD